MFILFVNFSSISILFSQVARVEMFQSFLLFVFKAAVSNFWQHWGAGGFWEAADSLVGGWLTSTLFDVWTHAKPQCAAHFPLNPRKTFFFQVISFPKLHFSNDACLDTVPSTRRLGDKFSQQLSVRVCLFTVAPSTLLDPLRRLSLSLHSPKLPLSPNSPFTLDSPGPSSLPVPLVL